jgi:hypothetical protein
MAGAPPIIRTQQQWIIAIDAEISHLQKVSKLLSGNGARGAQRVVSAEARARISAGMTKKWAERRKAASAIRRPLLRACTTRLLTSTLTICLRGRDQWGA